MHPALILLDTTVEPTIVQQLQVLFYSCLLKVPTLWHNHDKHSRHCRMQIVSSIHVSFCESAEVCLATRLKVPFGNYHMCLRLMEECRTCHSSQFPWDPLHPARSTGHTGSVHRRTAVGPGVASGRRSTACPGRGRSTALSSDPCSTPRPRSTGTDSGSPLLWPEPPPGVVQIRVGDILAGIGQLQRATQSILLVVTRRPHPVCQAVLARHVSIRRRFLSVDRDCHI